MNERSYASEGMDLKKYMLCLWRRLPLVFGAAFGGALLGALLYTMVRTVPESEREYQAFAKVYLDFAADETGEAYQAYNGYTWNDLMATDPIMDLTLSHLSSDYSREDVAASLKAEILSDIRLLTLTVTTHKQAQTDEILAAAVQALEEYGTQAKEFVEINAIQTTQAKLLVADSRMIQAVLLGLCLGLLLALFGVSLYYVLDDRILVAGDVRKVTEVSFVGYIVQNNGTAGVSREPAAGSDSAEEHAANGGLRETLYEDYRQNLAYLQEKYGTIHVCALEPGRPLAADDFTAVRQAQGVILSLPFGKVRGTFVSYVIEQLKTQDCVLCGVAIRGANEKFLQKYYGNFFGKKKHERGSL